MKKRLLNMCYLNIIYNNISIYFFKYSITKPLKNAEKNRIYQHVITHILIGMIQ